MSKSAKAYVATVILGGTAVAAFALTHWRSDDPTRLVAFLILFAAAAMLKFRVPGITGAYSAVFFFVLLGSATLSFSEVALASTLAGVVQSAFRTRQRASLHQVVFNVANLLISSACAFAFVRSLVPGLSDQPLQTSLILGATVYYCVNTLLVSCVLGLVEHESIWKIWQQWYLASLPFYMVGAAIVGALLSAHGWVTSLAVILVAPPLLLASIYFRRWLPQRISAKCNQNAAAYVD